MSDQGALLDQILSGQNRQLQVMAASGLVPLEPSQLIPLQVALTDSPDAEIAKLAGEALTNLEPRIGVTFLQQQATERELEWFGRHVQQPQVMDAILRRADVSRTLLEALAPDLWPEAQETLLLRQDAIIENPGILVALERNAQLSSYAKRRIWEYREHLLPRDKVPPKKPEEVLAEAEAWSDAEILEAVEEARGKPVEGETVEGAQGLNDGQVRSLPVPVRIRLARGADRMLRAVLVRDTNSQVALSVLQGGRLSDQEVELFANSRSVHLDVLVEIARRREWVQRYSVAKSLARNPRTQLSIAIRLLARLTVNDLRLLARDRNVAQAVRSNATRLYQVKR